MTAYYRTRRGKIDGPFYGKIHLTELDGRQTLCGIKMSDRWYLRRDGDVTCAKCLKKESKP